MRLSTRLLHNAASTYIRLGSTFAFGLFATWYLLGVAGVTGFGLIALAVSSNGVSHAIERTLRTGLVRELAAAMASGDRRRVQETLASSFRLCFQATVPLAALVCALVPAALIGVFNTPADQPQLRVALAILIAGEGVHASIRLVCAPYLQSLFAAQRVTSDNLLMVLSRATYALSCVVVFGWVLPSASLATQLTGFAITRGTLQLADVALGVWLAKRLSPDVRMVRSLYSEDEYRSIRRTVWHSAQVSVFLNTDFQFIAVLINLLLGVAYNGIWQVVVQLSGYVWMLSQGVLRGVEPLMANFEKEGRMQAATDLMSRSVRYQLAMVLPAGVVVGILGRPVLGLWIGRRLAADHALAIAGISAPQALAIAAQMTVVLVMVQILRGGFYGIERGLYGIGRVHSYAWFSKWASLISVGAAALSLAWLRQPLAAPLSLLLGHALYSPGVVLAAARRELALPVATTLRTALPRPLAASAALSLALLPVRLLVGPATVFGLAAVLLGTATLYVILTWAIVATPSERARLRHLALQGASRMGFPAPRRHAP